MFTITGKRELAPNVHEIVIEAPQVARKARAGQFVVVMVDPTSERVPYTLCDWDAEQGTITLVVLEAGRSSRKLILQEAGGSVVHLAGPLGVPLEIERLGAVALAVGCYGIGAARCLARALQAAGNRVLTIAEARSDYLHYYHEELAAASDEFVRTNIDGSVGFKGHAVDLLEERLREGERIDAVVAVGCPFMMMLVAHATRPFGVSTRVALSPIMLDGTGMCGACRVSVQGETRFACVDGPFFDAHQVDWEELFARRAAYAGEEVASVASSASVRRAEEQHLGGC